jgi:signal transduction histidine kinase
MEKEKEFAVVEAEAKLSREKAGELEKAYSELKKTQAQLIQAGKMAAVGQLAGGVAHEINNPMAVILGFAQILHSQIEQDSPLRMPVEQIEKEATRCKNLIQDLLVFSRTAKKTEEEVKLNEIAEEAVRLAEYQTKLGDIKIIKNLEQDVTLFGDKNGMQQVVINLIVNAKDAITDGGEIKVKTWEEGEKAFLSVQDTGVGIPEENLERIFEPFFTTKEVGKGTGLGLSLIYEIIQRHSGDIQVNSEVGKGTTFTISLPSGTKGRKTRQKPGINY